METLREIGIKDRCRIMSHIERKCETILETGTKYEEEVYEDIYRQALREAGAYSLEGIDIRYLFAIHDAIDCYQLPQVLEQKIHAGKRGENDAKYYSTVGNSELD